MNSFDHDVPISISQDHLEFRNSMNTHWLMIKSRFIIALQLTIFVYPVHIYHTYWPQAQHEFYWLQCYLWKLAAGKLCIFHGPGVTI